MAFKQINQLSQYMNEDSMLETYARGGKHFLLTKGGEIEIDSTTFGALNNGKPQVEGKYILNFDKIRKAWKVQTGTGPATGTPFAVGDNVSKVYFDTTSTPDFSAFTLQQGENVIAEFGDEDALLIVSDLTNVQAGFYLIAIADIPIWSSINFSTFTAGWQSNITSTGGVYSFEDTYSVTELDSTVGWNGVWCSKTAFAPSTTYDYFFELSNGEIIQPDSTAYNAIVTNQNGFYAINGDTNPAYYNQLGLIRAWTDGTNKFAQLINGDILPVSNTQWASFTSGSYPFAEVVDDTIYFNANKFIKLADNNTGKFIEFKGGQRIAVDSTLFNTIKGDLTKIGDKYYYDTTQIVRGTSLGNAEEYVSVTAKPAGLTVAVDMAIYKTKTSSSTSEQTFTYYLKNAPGFVSGQSSGDKIYFDKNKSTATIKSLLGMLTYDGSTHRAALLNTFLIAEELETNEYAIGFVANGETTYVYATKTFTPTGGTEITAGWHLTDDYYAITSETISSIGSPSDFNGKLISSTSFSTATYAWKLGSTEVTMALYGITYTGTPAEEDIIKTKYVINEEPIIRDLHLANGMIIADVSDAIYNAITSGFKALSGVKTNPVEIHKVFVAGNKYIAELKTGYQIEITQAEYNAIKP